MSQLEQEPASVVLRKCPHLRYAQEHHKGHGRIEHRQLLAATVRPDQIDWPGARQVVLLRRQRRVKGKVGVEFAAFVTSLRPDPVPRKAAAELLALTRGHWSIENRLFHVRDVSFGEDACRVRSGHAPQNLAAIRNAAITLLNQHGHDNKAAAQRRYAARPDEALALLRGP